MNAPDPLLYTLQHEWIRVEGATAGVGITDFAQHALGDITFVELPAVGRSLRKGDEAAAIESCKAAAGVFAPSAGTVVESNQALAQQPELVNQDPYGAGWIYKMKLADQADLAGLMNAAQYVEYCGKEASQ